MLPEALRCWPGSGLLSLLILAVTGMTGPFTRPPAQTAEDWEWVNSNFGPVLEALLRTHITAGMHVAYRSGWTLHTGVVEYSFVIGFDPNQSRPGLQTQLSAHVRMADSISIYEQMMALHQANRKESMASIQQKIKLRKFDVSEQACPAVRSQFTKFQAVRFSPPAFNINEVILDPMEYEFRIYGEDGDMILSITNEKQPLVVWALETRSTLERCALAAGAKPDANP
jgi:hypothetical protein